MAEVVQLNVNPNEVLCKKFTEWLGEAIPGSRFCYYEGAHVVGKTVGRLANNAYENGQIILFQKREKGQFQYWAQKRKPWGE